jgi:hypothetical protein
MNIKKKTIQKMWNKQTVVCLWSYASATLLHEKNVIFLKEKYTKKAPTPYCPKLPT